MTSHRSDPVLSPRSGGVLLAAALLVAACGDRPPEKKAVSQVAAKVNGGEISVHQVNYVLQRMPALPAEQAEQARRKVLDGLIEQELAVQKALDAKLERKPEIMQAIEVARRDILARAYLEQQAGAQGKPGADEVRKYYAEHPELFANRKIYRFEELTFLTSADGLEAIREQLGKGRSAAEIAAALRAAGVELGGGVTVKPAEQIALELLPKFAAAREGQPMLVENGGRAALITVLASKAEPVDEIKATPVIENFLLNRQKNDAAREAIRQLRESARIDYVGEFAAAPAAGESAASGKGAVVPVVNKGLAGLK